LQIKDFASDAKNQKGLQEEKIDIADKTKEVQIITKKAIHRAGEPIELEIFSTEDRADLFVDIVKDWSVVESRLVKLKDGRANLKIPYRADFKGELTIAAYLDDKGETVQDTKGVIYPAPNNLRLDIKPVQTVYRPNEEATIKFSVAAPDKSLAETALGVVVFDKAIEERARTDADFGGGNVNLFGNFSDLLESKSFGGVSLKQINEMDSRQKFSAELQL
jgi:hypothetical protein